MLLCALSVTGCAAGGSGTEISAFQLQVDGEPGEREVHLPASLEPLLPAETSRYRLRTEITPADAAGDYFLELPAFAGILEVRVGGAIVPPVEANLGDVYRGTGPPVYAIHAAQHRGQPMTLDITVDHVWQKTAWWPVAPRLSTGPPEALRSYRIAHANRWISGAGMGALAVISFTYLLMFLADRRNQGAAWIALQTGTAGYYVAYTLGITQSVGPYWDVVLVGCLLCIAVTVSVPAAKALFGEPPPSRLWLLGPALGILTAAVFSSPFEIPVAQGVATVVVLNVTWFYQMGLCLSLLRRDAPPAGVWPNLIAWVGLALIASPDFIPWMGLGEPLEGLRLGGLGLTVYSLAQFGFIVRSYITSLRAAERRENEVIHLNAELRRQVGDRARQLTDSLARLAAQDAGTVVLEPGALIGEHYEVEAPLGRGAMGAVHLAHHRERDERFAIKILEHVPHIRALARFAREAQIGAALQHPHVVGIRDMDIDAQGFMFIALEYADGPTLGAMKRQLAGAAALPVLAQVAQGIAAIHAEGIVHRDLKPDNILLATHASGAVTAKIADFGVSGLLERVDEGEITTLSEPPPSLTRSHTDVEGGSDAQNATGTEQRTADDLPEGARGADKGRPALTHVGAIMGTPAYMAPETKSSGETRSTAIDIFAFGVIAWEFVTGLAPRQVRARVLNYPSEAIMAAFPSARALPPEVCAALARCVSLDPTKRPTADTLSARLSAFYAQQVRLERTEPEIAATSSERAETAATQVGAD